MAGLVDAIKAKTDTIGALTITYQSPATESGSFTIYGGDNYLAAEGRALSVTITDYAGPSLTSATAKFRILALADHEATETAADLEVAATVSVDGTTVTLAAPLTAAQTAALSPYPPASAPRNYVFQYIVTTAGGSVLRLATGRMTVHKGIAASS